MVERNSKQDNKDIANVRSAVLALEAGEHNPVDWTPIIQFVAPMVARIAARYAAKYVGQQVKKRISPRLATATAEKTAERIVVILTKKALKGR